MFGYRRHFRRSKQLIHSDSPAALQALTRAIRRWGFGLFSNRRDARIGDLRALSEMLDILKSLPVSSAARSQATDLQAITAEMTALFSDRSNFGIDGQMMKCNAATQWATLDTRLKQGRKLLVKKVTTRSGDPAGEA